MIDLLGRPLLLLLMLLLLIASLTIAISYSLLDSTWVLTKMDF